jgi:hypothetical protein
MRIIDSILALLGLAGFVAFLGIIAVYVREPVLVLIFVICAAMAAFDFARDIITKRYRPRGMD